MEPATQKEIEELSQKISFKMADKMEAGDMDVQKMAETIGSFLSLVNEEKTFMELNNFIESL